MSHDDALNEIKKLQEEFNKLKAETESLVERKKGEDRNKIEKVAANFNIVIEQIDKLTTNLDMLKEKGDKERLFVSMKRAEIQIKSLE